MYSLFAFRMEIDTADLPFELIEADVVETLETSAGYRPYAVVWHQEMLFPAHEDRVLLTDVRDGHGPFSSQFLEGPEGTEPSPVAEVDPGIGAPVVVLSDEGILVTNYLAFEVCGQGRVVLSEACRARSVSNPGVEVVSCGG